MTTPPAANPQSPVAPTVEANLSMQFINYSATTFTLGVDYWDISAVGGEIIQSPANQLAAYAGSQTLSEYQILSNLASAGVDLYTIWYDPGSGWRFGIKIHAPVQVFGIGARPYWFVMYDQQSPSSDANWIASGSDPSTPYTWPTTIGFNIVATPQSGHSSLLITANIEDL